MGMLAIVSEHKLLLCCVSRLSHEMEFRIISNGIVMNIEGG